MTEDAPSVSECSHAVYQMDQLQAEDRGVPYSLLPCLVGLVPLVQHVRDSLARLPHFFGENERFHLLGG
ncbi:MAG: hypothetical protein NTV46_10550 [Verrucomicrobia bacterium]|nr:hypothetical protein [Verrucomicrobiota bacterium]